MGKCCYCIYQSCDRTYFIALVGNLLTRNHVPYFIPADQPSAKLPDGSAYSYLPTFNHGWEGIAGMP
jgi:hypothetical protein